jgi:hypothetical protein
VKKQSIVSNCQRVGGAEKEILGLLTVKLIITGRSIPYMMVSGSKFRKVIENSLIFISVAFQSLSGSIRPSPFGEVQRGLNWINLAQDGNKWYAVVNIVESFGVPICVGNFLTG